MLTEKETCWLITRENVELVTGTYSCAHCQFMDNEEEECIFRRCPVFNSAWQDSAEFEGRVVAKLATYAHTTPCEGNKPCPYKNRSWSWSCDRCNLKHARIAVEEEMEKI